MSQSPRVLVTGMGPIGFTAVVAAVARGWPVTMLGRDERSSFRARLACQLGGCYQSMEATEFRPADVEASGYDLLLECTGSDGLMLQAAQLVRSCGVVVWLGSNRVPQSKNHNVDRMVREGLLRNQIFLGCVNAARRDFEDALQHLTHLAADRRDVLASLITCRVLPAESLWQYEHREPQGIKTVLMFDQPLK